MSYPNRLIDLKKTFGQTTCALSDVCNFFFCSTVDHIYTNNKHLLEFDHVRLTPEKLALFSSAVYRQAGSFDCGF
jgi:hypothetical protein